MNPTFSLLRTQTYKWLPLLALCCALLAGSAHAQQTVEITTAGSAPKTVDFDVPIMVKIEWPASIKGKVVPGTAFPFVRSVRTYRLKSEEKPSLAPFDEKDKEWVEVTDQTTWRAEKDHLYVVLSRLSANQYYRFAFLIERKLTKEEGTRFETAALEKLDQFFRQATAFETTGNKIDLNMAGIKKKMRAAIEEVAGSKIEVKVKKNSWFDVGADSESNDPCSPDVFLKQSIKTGDLEDALTNRQTYVNNLDDSADTPSTLPSHNSADKQLQDLSYTPDSPLAMVQTALIDALVKERANRPTNNTLVDILGAWVKLVEILATQMDTHHGALATGRVGLKRSGELTSKLPPIQQAWRTEALKARTQNIKYTRDALAEVNAAIMWVRPQVGKNAKIKLDALRRDLSTIQAELTKTLQNATFKNLHQLLGAREQLLKDIIKKGIEELVGQENLYAVIPTTAVFETRSNWYISADVGMLYAPTPEEVTPYLGVNFYLVPVNKDAPLGSFPFWDSLLRRFALMVGVTTGSIESNVRTDLVSGRALLLGAGFRITDTVRLSGGTMLFKEKDPNPLNEKTNITSSAFFSFSVDVDVRTSLGQLYDALFK